VAQFNALAARILDAFAIFFSKVSNDFEIRLQTFD
jgi:hypothetical protein